MRKARIYAGIGCFGIALLGAQNAHPMGHTLSVAMIAFGVFWIGFLAGRS